MTGPQSGDARLTRPDDAADPTATETALRASEARFRALVAASSDVLYRMSPDWSACRW